MLSSPNDRYDGTNDWEGAIQCVMGHAVRFTTALMEHHSENDSIPWQQRRVDKNLSASLACFPSLIHHLGGAAHSPAIQLHAPARDRPPPTDQQQNNNNSAGGNSSSQSPPCLSSERDAEVRSERRSETGMTPTGGRTRANGRNRAQATSPSFPAHCRTAVYSMDRPTDLTRMGVARPRSSSPATQKPKLR